MKRFLILLSLLTVPFSAALAAAPKNSEYFYQKEFQTSQDMKGKTIGIPLAPKDLQLISPTFNNIQLINQNNDPVPFEVFTQKPGKKKKGFTILKVSSNKDGEPRHLLDNDVLSTYEFDKKIDGREPASILIDLGQKEWVNRINMFYSDRKTIRTYEIEAGLTLDKIRKVKKRSEMKQVTEFLTPRAMRYVRIKWWGPQIKIDDINFFLSSQGAVYFDAEEAQTYRILFGNPQIRSARYGARHGSAKSDIPLLDQSRTEINEFLAEDIDGDGIPNVEDNCLGIPNKGQADQDQDLVGDKCDNAPENKNRYQYDLDWDNVGDIIDNCKMDFNPDQKDRDDDGFGNECDNAHMKEPVINHRTKPYFFYGILLVLAFGIVAMFANEKMRKKVDKEK